MQARAWATHVVEVGFPEQVLEEFIWITQASAGDYVLVGYEAVAPVEAKHVLPGACSR